ncbi:N-acetylglucosamine-6-phosphate deacetylase [Endozoicomonadaceae bacterium StTr2]
MLGLKNAVIHTGDKTLHDHCVLIRDRHIQQVLSLEEGLANSEVSSWVDLNGHHLAPGLIDLQLNGGDGVMLNGSVSHETLDTMQQMCFRTGCTRFLPTLITTSVDEMLQAIETVRQWKFFTDNPEFGLHLEGPFINPEYKGVHEPKYIQTPSPELISTLCDHSDVISMITLAPECCPAGTIELLADAGIHVAIGHSGSTWDQACDAFRHGAHCVTHLFNQMAPLHHREPGIIGATLDTPGIHAGFIADGYHVAWPVFHLCRRLMKQRLFLVTDGMPPSGSKTDTFVVQGRTMRVEDGRCTDSEGRLCGSALTMIQAVRNCVEQGGIELDEALRMGSLYAATALGTSREFGAIKAGMRADLVLFDDDFTIKQTFLNGQPVYREV